MKNVIVMLFVVFTTITFAQKKQGNANNREKLSTEQQIELQLKKMTLDLSLTEKQQKDIKPILLKQAQKREESMASFKEKKEKDEKLTSDQKFEMKSKKLDQQIEMKAEMKKILSVEQMTKWEAKKDDRMKSNRTHKKQRKTQSDKR